MLVLLTVLFVCGAAVASAQVQNASNIVIDDDGMASPTNCSATLPAFTSIQAGINAASPNATVTVCPGTYAEQVKISAKTIRLKGKAEGNNNLILIKPNGVTQNSTSISSGNPIAAVILVEAAANVLIDNLTVDGAMNGLTGCSPNLVGVFFRNSTGSATNNTVRNIKLGAGLEGCQSGLGIFIQTGSAPGFNSVVTLMNNSVHDYQKNGITANEANTKLTARGNSVTGFGPNPNIAQNGIQVAFGATGLIETNSVINHIYSPCTTASCSAVSTNILVSGSNAVTVRSNRLGKSQVSIYYVGNSGIIQSNAVVDTDAFDGIVADGDNNDVLSNTIANSDEAGIYVAGNGNDIKLNSINEAPIGVIDDGTATVVPVAGAGANRFYNTAEKVAIPAPRAQPRALTGSPESGATSAIRP